MKKSIIEQTTEYQKTIDDCHEKIRQKIHEAENRQPTHEEVIEMVAAQTGNLPRTTGETIPIEKSAFYGNYTALWSDKK